MNRDKGSPEGGQVRPHYLVDQVIEALQDAMEKGVYKVGDRLPPEMKLAAQFGVGRSTIREALRVLSHLNRVETRTGSGSYVVDHRRAKAQTQSAMSLDEAADIYAFRYAVEAPAAEQAALRRTARQMKAIRQLLERAKEHLEAQDINAVAAVDTDLHIAILEAGESRFAAELYRTHRARIEQAFKALLHFTGPAAPGTSTRSLQSLHDDLVAAIERGDSKLAARLVNRDRKEVEIWISLARKQGKSKHK
ncbi:FCD domain-containing protein [Sphingosinicella sp.]|uniref:FadR/GntR family transcriptional regulator n=1 Tax=Sphingosinicella sp. TaxID=1917971 RepID=UPI0017A71BA0|nr:FCD domain-containing protein [Sphingosinicella sp.]MBA4759021.1 FadR family transcriptional regulator [Sphingosinicella sp.]